MELIDYVRGYKQISGIRRIPIALNKNPKTGEKSIVIGNEDIDRFGLRIKGKPYMPDKDMEKLFKGEVVIEEKVDGHPIIILYLGYTFFCESLKIKHTVEYEKVPYSADEWPDMVVVYDVLEGEKRPPYKYGQGQGKWLSRSDKEQLCNLVGAPLVPLVFKGRITPEKLPKIAQRISGFGSNQAEGIVLKNFRTGVFGKFINVEFQKAITDESLWGGRHPEQLGIRNIRRFARGPHPHQTRLGR